MRRSRRAGTQPRVPGPGGRGRGRGFGAGFEANRTAEVGETQVGARITAGGLDEALRKESYRIRECSRDAHDAVQNLVIVLEKTDASDAVTMSERSFREVEIIERGWISGVYDDVATRTVMHERQAKETRPLTFFDD